MYKIGYVMFYGFISQISAKFKSAFSLINVIGSFGSHKNTLPLTLGSLRIGFSADRCALDSRTARTDSVRFSNPSFTPVTQMIRFKRTIRMSLSIFVSCCLMKRCSCGQLITNRLLLTTKAAGSLLIMSHLRI